MPIAGLLGVQWGSAAWGDYDHDGRLDFLLTGWTNGTEVSQLWRNATPLTNTPPTAPTALAMTASSNAVMLSWNSATDGQTPGSGLSYNVRADVGLAVAGDAGRRPRHLEQLPQRRVEPGDRQHHQRDEVLSPVQTLIQTPNSQSSTPTKTP